MHFREKFAEVYVCARVRIVYTRMYKLVYFTPTYNYCYISITVINNTNKLSITEKYVRKNSPQISNLKLFVT